jgi:uncharacterized protein YjbJ (UPF0337 family)
MEEVSSMATQHAGGRSRETGHERTAHDLKERGGELIDDAREQAGRLGDQAKGQARSQIEEQKEHATDQLGVITSALRKTSSNLREEEHETVASYIDQAARQVDKLSSYLRNHSVGDLFAEVEGYARREPALFLGGAVLLGLFGARFMKSSAERDRGYATTRQRGFDRGIYGRSEFDRPARMRPQRPEYSGGFERQAETTFREERGYTGVHGTSGATMPDPTGSSRSAGERPGTESTTFGSEQRPEGRRER